MNFQAPAFDKTKDITMSVPKSERQEAKAAYVDAVANMKKEVFITTRKWPKRWQNDEAADIKSK